jgi:hypothetical protein
MLRNRVGRIALGAVLAFGVLSIGTTQSSALDVQNGLQGPYRIIKSFALVTFEYGVWAKRMKQEAVEHECQSNDKRCHFHVARTLFFENCTVAGAGTAEPGMCGVGVAEPQGLPLPEGPGSLYSCPRGAIVKTVSNLLFIPQSCINEDEM